MLIFNYLLFIGWFMANLIYYGFNNQNLFNAISTSVTYAHYRCFENISMVCWFYDSKHFIDSLCSVIVFDWLAQFFLIVINNTIVFGSVAYSNNSFLFHSFVNTLYSDIVLKCLVKVASITPLDSFEVKFISSFNCILYQKYDFYF